MPLLPHYGRSSPIQGFRSITRAPFLTALDLWGDSNLDFADCLAASRVQHANLECIYSYDRDFDRIPGIRRLEP